MSDLEVDTAEENGSLWSIRYPIVGGRGDRRRDDAARDHARRYGRRRAPKDERYAQLHGKQLELPLTGRTIPIVPIDIIRDGKAWPDRLRHRRGKVTPRTIRTTTRSARSRACRCSR